MISKFLTSKFVDLFLVGLLAVVFVLVFALNRLDSGFSLFYVLGMGLVGVYLVDGVLYSGIKKFQLIKSYSTFILIRCVAAGLTGAITAHFLLN